jgi:peptide/nickel transport system substrate-binding protein
VDWTSQISGPTLAVQAQYLDQDITNKYIPFAPTLSKYITADQAVARYNNLKTFYGVHKHFVLGTGPYYVDQVFPVEGTITVSRYDKYLFPSDQFSIYGAPELMSGSVDGPVTLAAGTDATYNVTIKFKAKPYPSKDIDKVSYLLFNVNGDLVTSGTATFASEGSYTVALGKDVTAKLNAGTAKLTVTASSKTVSLPAIVSTQIVITK